MPTRHTPTGEHYAVITEARFQALFAVKTFKWRTDNKNRFVLLLCVMLACQATWAGPIMAEGLELRISDPLSSELLLSLPLEKDETFTIRYIHSVDRTPVFEIFGADGDGMLELQATFFKMFGAGMGHRHGIGMLDFDGDWTWIKDINETLRSFILRIGSPSVAHTIIHRDREINLSEKWPRRRVCFEVQGREAQVKACSCKRTSRKGEDN